MYEGLYQIRDKVLIVDEYHISMDGSKGHSKMEEFCSKEMTIKNKLKVRASTKTNDYHYYYQMIEDNGKWSWIEKIIKGKVLEKGPGLSSFTLPTI